MRSRFIDEKQYCIESASLTEIHRRLGKRLGLDQRNWSKDAYPVVRESRNGALPNRDSSETRNFSRCTVRVHSDRKLLLTRHEMTYIHS